MGGWGGGEDTSCYTSKHPTSSADVTEIGEKKREKRHTAVLLYVLLRLIEHSMAFKYGNRLEKCGQMQQYTLCIYYRLLKRPIKRHLRMVGCTRLSV